MPDVSALRREHTAASERHQRAVTALREKERRARDSLDIFRADAAAAKRAAEGARDEVRHDEADAKRAEADAREKAAALAGLREMAALAPKGQRRERAAAVKTAEGELSAALEAVAERRADVKQAKAEAAAAARKDTEAAEFLAQAEAQYRAEIAELEAAADETLRAVNRAAAAVETELSEDLRRGESHAAVQRHATARAEAERIRNA